MDFLFDAFLSFLLVYKYAALFAITFVAALILPLPASTTIVAANVFAFQGYLNFPAVFGAALLGNIAGDNLGYFISRKYGEKFLRLIGFNKILNSAAFAILKMYIDTNCSSLFYFSRFMTSVGPSVNILAGLAAVPYGKYLLYEISGEMSYILLYSAVGFYLGSQWEYSVYFLTTAGVFMTSLGLLFFLVRARFLRI